MPSKLSELFATIIKGGKLEKGSKMWFIGMKEEDKKGKQKIMLKNNTLTPEEETPQSPRNSGFTTLIF